jgi:hypothetical protein
VGIDSIREDYSDYREAERIERTSRRAILKICQILEIEPKTESLNFKSAGSLDFTVGEFNGVFFQPTENYGEWSFSVDSRETWSQKKCNGLKHVANTIKKLVRERGNK